MAQSRAGDFANVVSKFKWARRQIAELDLAVTDYVDLEPYVGRVEDEPETQSYRVTAHLRYPPPATIAHIVGDVLNSLHGTLDYLAAELVLREGETPDRKTLFPIKGPNRDKAEPWVNITRAGEGGRGEVSVIEDSEVLSRLRNVQPYQNGDQWAAHPLQVLRTLNGESKHRRPVIVAAAINDGHYAYMAQGSQLPNSSGIDPGAQVLMLTANHMPLYDGDEIARIPYATAPEGGPPENREFTTFVALEQAAHAHATGQPLSVVQLLNDIWVAIARHVITPFAPLFGYALHEQGIGGVAFPQPGNRIPEK